MSQPAFRKRNIPPTVQRRALDMKQGNLFSNTSKAKQSAACFGIVLSLHMVALCAVIRESGMTLPNASVPLSVTFATASEPERAKPKTAVPKPKAVPRPMVANDALAELEPTPEPSLVKEEPAPPQVTPPRFDAAYLNNPVPAYPALSRRTGEQGRVWLRVFVGPDGSARDVTIQSSSGYARLDRSAKEAVERWKFAPARNGDNAVGAWVLVPISFTLFSKG
jgi:periplasmic protein TonB